MLRGRQITTRRLPLSDSLPLGSVAAHPARCVTGTMIVPPVMPSTWLKQLGIRTRICQVILLFLGHDGVRKCSSVDMLAHLTILCFSSFDLIIIHPCVLLDDNYYFYVPLLSPCLMRHFLLMNFGSRHSTWCNCDFTCLVSFINLGIMRVKPNRLPQR